MLWSLERRKDGGGGHKEQTLSLKLFSRKNNKLIKRCGYSWTKYQVSGEDNNAVKNVVKGEQW